MSARKYFLLFIGQLLLVAALMVAFNRVVDPFWYYRDISISGFNAIKPKFQFYERHVKPALVQQEQPASLIFGGSYSEIGFDPLHPALRAAGSSYNFAMAGEAWDMYVCDVLFALKHDAALRQIVLGITPGSLPSSDCQPRIRKMESVEQRAFLFSTAAFEASVNTVLEQHLMKPSHTAEGMYFYTRGTPGIIWRFRQDFHLNPVCKTPPPAGSLQPPARLDLSGLQDVLRQAASRGITVKVVVYPRHALHLERQYQCGIRQAKWDALKQIVPMVLQESGGLAEVWDFEGYHDIGTELIDDSAGHYWQDPGHFNYEFGNIMLDEMFALKPPAYGMKLTSSSLAERAETERRMRADYLARHPEFREQLESFLPQNAN